MRPAAENKAANLRILCLCMSILQVIYSIIWNRKQAFGLPAVYPAGANSMTFNTDFVWGEAVSGYQTEGAAYADGKGLSIWDVFCTQKGRILEQNTGDVSCDMYHKWKEDIQLMKQFGIRNFRF